MRKLTTIAKTIGIQAFAANVARNDTDISKAAAPYAQAYMDADATGKAQLLNDWKLGYVREKFSLNGIAVGDDQITKGNGATKKTYIEVSPRTNAAKRIGVVQLIDRANAQFREYVSGTPKTKAAPSEHVVVSRKAKAAALELCACFDNETLNGQIEAAIKVLRSMKK